MLLEDSEIKKCYNTGDVITTYRAGGITGYLGGGNTKGYIENCYNTGGGVTAKNNYIGGIAWIPNDGGGEIKNTYNIGDVIAEKTTDRQGSIAGVSDTPEYSIINCYYLEGTNAGGMNKEDVKEQAESRTETQMKDPEFIKTLNKDNENEEWKKDDGSKNDGYPILKWQEVEN